MKILLGYEVGTGTEVYLEDGQTVVTGMTQLSGKTTTLEALVTRGEVTAVAFLTKRGESGFRNQREIPPYFKEQKRGTIIDWQYVEAIVEATMGEKMKIERSFIIDCCNGSARRGLEPAKNLEEVYTNFKNAQKDATRGLDQSIFTNLAAYFEIILPQIKKYNFSNTLELRKGFNVLNLIGMEEEMQQLVIESVLSYVYEKMRDVVVVIPEAHKFIPQGLKTPVKGTALRLIKEGAGIGNFMWIDTQDTTSTDKALLKQCSNWIMGYQQEKNEVKNVRENIGRRKITDEDIMNLKIGHFIASLRQKIYQVYVLPAGIDPEVGRAVAMSKITVDEVKAMVMAEKGEYADITKIKITPALTLEEVLRDADEDELDLIGRLQTELAEANRKLLEQEEKLHVAKIELHETVEELETKAQGLQDEVDEISLRVGEVVAQNKEKDWVIDNQKKDLEIEKEAYEELKGEHERFVAFDNALKILISPYIERFLQESILPEALSQIQEIRKIIREEISKLSSKQREKITDSTGIPWVDMWLPKLKTPMLRKIVRTLAARIGVPLTKDQLALATVYSVKSGTFNQALRDLERKYKVIKVIEGKYSIVEGPPE